MDFARLVALRLPSAVDKSWRETFFATKQLNQVTPTRSPRARTQSPMAVCVQVCTTHPTSDSAPLQLVFPDAEVYWPPLGKLSLALHSVFAAFRPRRKS